MLCVQVAFAQFRLPDLSPDAEVIQQVGYTTFKIHYGRPAVRQRKIFGELVPYGKLWRTGAGKCTTFYFDKDVTIGEKTVTAGKYAVVTIPGETAWTVMLNSDTSKNYGDPREYNTSTEVVRFTVKTEKAPRFYESLTIDLDVMKDDAILYLSWENTQIHFPILTGTFQKLVSDFPKILSTKSDNDDAYLLAAWYYYMNNENTDQALAWVNRVLNSKQGDNRWAYNLKVDLLERSKNFSEARKTANEAIAFLTKEKPDEWQVSVSEYESKIKRWPKS